MTTLVLDAKNPLLRDMYAAAMSAMRCPEAFKKMQAEAIAIFAAMQGRDAMRIGKMVSLGRMVDAFGENALPAIALAERLDMLRLQPCMKRFLVCRPFWYGHAVEAAASTARYPQAGLFWVHACQSNAEDVDMALRVAFDNVQDRLTPVAARGRL